MKIVLSYLLEVLTNKGVISTEDVSEIQDLYSLTSILEGKSSSLLGEEERNYVNKVNKALDSGRLNDVRELEPPALLQRTHKVLLGILPALGEIKGN